jgi:glutamate racemase
VAKEIKEILKTVDSKSKHQGNPLREFYVTDSPERFIKVGELFLENKIEHIEKISVDI